MIQKDSKPELSPAAREHLEGMLVQDLEFANDYAQNVSDFRSWLELNEEIRRWSGIAPATHEEIEEIVKEYADRRGAQ